MTRVNGNMAGGHGEATRDLAVFVNANAGKATRRLLNSILEMVPREDVFLSTDRETGRRQLGTILERGYSRLAVGGGDGTLAFVMENLFQMAGPEGVPGVAPSQLPRLLILKMGTGNALANHVGARHALNDLEQVLTGEVPVATRKLGLMEVDGRLSFFAGMGLDAMIAADYADLQKELSTTALSGSVKGLGAYWWAVMTRTVPRVMREKYAQVKVINNGPIAYQVNSRTGLTEKTFYKGEEIYDGPCLIACAGTLPYYGFNMRMFPHFSRLPGFFQLKVASTGLAETLASMPSVWRGTMENENIMDVLASEVSLRFSREVPIQVSGDPDGWRSSMTVRMYPHIISLISFAGGHP